VNEPCPPVVPIPAELTDEAAVQLLEFLYELARVLENHYAGQLRRYYTPPEPDEEQLNLWRDPPF
jgi:hypothetical protein